jgi:uncharacterized protein
MKPQINADERRSTEDKRLCVRTRHLEGAVVRRALIRICVHRRSSAAAFCLLTAMSAALTAGEVTNTRGGAHSVVQPVELDEVHWTGGFWADRFKMVHEKSIPAMWEIMKGTKYKPFYQNFLIAAGELEGEYHGAQWNDGDFYKFLEAVCAVYATTHDPQLEAILDQSIVAIGNAQRVDGYIHTPVLIRQRNGEQDAKPFQDRQNFEMYNMGHLITAACMHHRVTGRDEFLNIARKTADFLCTTFRTPTPELARNSVCPSHYMAMVELYRTTREPRYLELAQKFLDMRKLVADGGDDNQDRIPFLEQREAAGHAVRANYLYAGAADLLVETGDDALRKSLEAIWKNVVEKKMYVTGGCGALYDGASPDGSPDQSTISRVHQAYGRNYQLPNVAAHNETCAAIGSVLWNWRMFRATGEARYVDVLELALYNAVLSGISLDGTNYFYVNPLRQLEPLPAKLRWSRGRVPFVTSYCCPPNVLRTIADVNGYVYCKTDDAIWINLYGGSKLSTTIGGHSLKLSQQTNYPWDGRVQVTIVESPPIEFSLKLRIPGWADKATLQINGSAANLPAKPGSYAELSRNWKAGDVAELQFPMPARLIEANPLVEETRNQVAVKRGPIVYCLESPDLPKDVRVQDVAIPANSKLSARYDAEFLNGVTVIEANANVRQFGDWDGKLYRPLAGIPEREIKARFIPYFAWANRGPSEMSVWLPLK